MKRILTENKRFWGFGLLLLAAVLILLFLLLPGAQTIDDLIQEIYTLPTDTTIQTLEQDGYINLTDVQPERISEIHAFFREKTVSGKTILKTVTNDADGPVITIFYRPEQSPVVSRTTYNVAQQTVSAQGFPYYWYTNEVSKDDGVTEVWLEPYNDSEPFLLYCYNSN